MRKSDHPTEQIDPAIVKCMDIAMAKLRKEVKGASSAGKVQGIMDTFYRSLEAEESFETSYRSISGAMSFGAGRIAIGVRMGQVSRLRVFNSTSGQVIPVPKALDWSLSFDAQPNFLPGGMIAVNGPGIQDAGVRYGYRLLFLSPSPNGYKLAQAIRGIWTLEDESESHLRVNGLVASVNTIESPKSFFTDNTTRLFATNTIYELDQVPFKVRSKTLGTAVIRAVDEWMAEAMKSSGNELSKKFAESYGTEKQMLEGHKEEVQSPDSYIVTLTFEKTYKFVVKGESRGFRIVSVEVTG